MMYYHITFEDKFDNIETGDGRRHEYVDINKEGWIPEPNLTPGRVKRIVQQIQDNEENTPVICWVFKKIFGLSDLADFKGCISIGPNEGDWDYIQLLNDVTTWRALYPSGKVAVVDIIGSSHDENDIDFDAVMKLEGDN